MTASGQWLPIFDSHLHIIDPRYPLVPNQGYLPDPFTVADYLDRAGPLSVTGGAVVSGSFQACDQDYLLVALAELGPGYVGVTQLPPDTTDARLTELDAAGVRALRCNLVRGGRVQLDEMARLARRAHAVAGWHVEVYVDGNDLAGLADWLLSLPRVVIDHLGLARAGLPTLRRLVAGGVAVKTTGFGRLDFDPAPVIRELASIDPGALLFGTDLPSTRAPRPFRIADLELVHEQLPAAVARRVLYDNAVALYRPRQG